jgi:hypothetical protein
MEVRSVPCSAHSSRTGLPCKRWAIQGGTVCPTHGGSIQRVKISAADRLAEMVDPALTALHALLAADSETVRLGAIKDVLDRNGLKPVERQEVTGHNGSPITFTLHLGDADPV